MTPKLLYSIFLAVAMPAMADLPKTPAAETRQGQTPIATVQTDTQTRAERLRAAGTALKRIGGSVVYYTLALLVFEDDRLPVAAAKRERDDGKEEQ